MRHDLTPPFHDEDDPMRGKHLLLAIMLPVATLVPQLVEAQPERAGQNIAVLSLDGKSTSETLAENIKTTLTQNTYEVISEAELQRTIDARRISPPAEDVSRKFSGISETIAAGIRSYFYEGHDAAIQALDPIVQLGIKHKDLLTHRPDVATQIYEAGAVLLRAYDDRGDRANTLRMAQLLATHFPHMMPSSETTPPHVRERVQAQRDRLAEQRTSVKLEIVEPRDGCTLYLNGLPALPQRYYLDNSTEYYVRLDCGRPSAYIWRLTPKKGSDVQTPVPDNNPLEHRMGDDSFESRAVAEQYMRAVMHWGRLDRMLGLSESSASTNSRDDSFLLVRVDRDKPAIWSDGATTRTVNRLLARVLPELTVAPVEPEPVDSNSKLLPWIGTGVGVASLITGAVVFIPAYQERSRLQCSSLTGTADPSACQGVDGYDATDFQPGGSQHRAGLSVSDAFNEASSDNQRDLIIGGVALGVGAALTTVSLIYLLSDDDPEPRATLTVSPTLGGAMVGWHARF